VFPLLFLLFFHASQCSRSSSHSSSMLTVFPLLFLFLFHDLHRFRST
jgi:hypothetical protein